MDNPDDDYLSDNEMAIQNLHTNLRTATFEVSDLCIKLETAQRIIRNTLWMAQRYADGRRSYAVGMYNDAVRLALEHKFVNPERDHTTWALDGTKNHAMACLSETENIEAIKNFDEIADLRERLSDYRATIAAQSAALATAQEFVAEELKCREASMLTSDGSADDEENEKYVADARRVLAVIDASKGSSNV